MRIGDSVYGRYLNSSQRWLGKIVGVEREPDLFQVRLNGACFRIFECDLELARGDEREIKVELGGRGE